jgi:hypothetical protein
MITEESSVVMIAHAANMTMQRQREAAKKKQPQASHRPSSAKKAKLPPLSTIAKAGMLRELRYCAAGQPSCRNGLANKRMVWGDVWIRVCKFYGT